MVLLSGCVSGSHSVDGDLRTGLKSRAIWKRAGKKSVFFPGTQPFSVTLGEAPKWRREPATSANAKQLSGRGFPFPGLEQEVDRPEIACRQTGQSQRVMMIGRDHQVIAALHRMGF